MKIGVLTSLYPFPEAPFQGIFAARKWEGMVQRGHDVQVVVPVPHAPRVLAPLFSEEQARLGRVPREELRSGVRVVRPRYLHLPRAAAANARRFAAAGRRAAPEGVDAWVFDYAWPAAAAAFVDAPVVVNGRGSDVLQVRQVPALEPVLAAGLARADALTAVSQDLLDAMGELRAKGGGDGAAPRVLIPNGVDEAHFSPGDRGEARARLGVAGTDGPLVVVVGHLIPRKDPLLALEAFARAGARDARLAFVGRGELEGEVRGRAAALGLGARVDLVGERPPEELVDWYRAASALLLTSSREGRPNVVLEALSTGCPVLATDAGGTSEIVPDHGRMLARDRDPAAIGAQLRDLLENPPASEGLRASVADLSWKGSLDALEELLVSLTAARAR